MVRRVADPILDAPERSTKPESLREISLDDPNAHDFSRFDVVDDVSMEAYRERVENSVDVEGKVAKGWDSLSPAQKGAVLATSYEGANSKVGQGHPMWIDEKNVDPYWRAYWHSTQLAAEKGWWGYKPVAYSEATRKWVPNWMPVGADRFIRHGRMILCAKPKVEWVREKALEYRESFEAPKLADQRFRSILVAARKKLGITKAQAERLEREGAGYAVSRGQNPEPDNDFLTQEEISQIEREEMARAEAKSRKGRTVQS